MRQARWCALVLTAIVAAPAGAAGPKGSLVFAGGALRFDNAAVWGRFVELAGGKGSPIVVVPAASGNPVRSGQVVVENLQRYGARAELAPLGAFSKGAARDPVVVALIRKARGVWFIGGDQRRITDALLDKGERTPALDAIWEVYRGGGVLGGSSAGAAVMSRVMFADALSSLDTIKYGIVKGKHVDTGLGFIGEDWFVDQHFLARGRFARALRAMRDFGFAYGVGIDEDTAIVAKGGAFEVVGYNGALILDVSAAEEDRRQSEFNLKRARLTYLDAGDRMDAVTRKVTVHASKAGDLKIDPRAKDFVPEKRSAGEFYFPDMLASGSIYTAMRNALESRKGVARGLAFAQPEGGAKNDLGFEFKVYRGDDAAGWYTARGGHDCYTIVGMQVDITPVKLADPLYTPLKP